MNIVLGANSFFGYGYATGNAQDPSKAGDTATWWSTYTLNECPDDWRSMDIEDVEKQLQVRSLRLLYFLFRQDGYVAKLRLWFSHGFSIKLTDFQTASANSNFETEATPWMAKYGHSKHCSRCRGRLVVSNLHNPIATNLGERRLCACRRCSPCPPAIIRPRCQHGSRRL